MIPFCVICEFPALSAYLDIMLKDKGMDYVSHEFNILPDIFEFNTLRQRQNGRHFPDVIFKWIILTDNVWISITISLKFVPKGSINNIPVLVQVMAWCRPGDKPLSEPMMVRYHCIYVSLDLNELVVKWGSYGGMILWNHSRKSW